MLSGLETRIKHVHKKIKNHKCEICNLSFGWQNTLKDHIANIHGGLKDHISKMFTKQKITIVDFVTFVAKLLANQPITIVDFVVVFLP